MRNFCGCVLGALENHAQIGSMCSRKLQHRYCKKCIFPRGRGGIGTQNYEMIWGTALAFCTGEQTVAGDRGGDGAAQKATWTTPVGENWDGEGGNS